MVSTAFILWSATIDREHIEKGEYIKNHKSRFMLRLSFVTAIAVYSIPHGIASGFLFWALFDQVLNLERKLPFWYLGTVAKTDIFFSNKKWLYISIKISSLILSLYLFLS